MEFADVATPIIPFGGVISDFVVDAVRNKISPPRPFAVGGGHVSKMQELQQFLEDNGAEAKISFDEEFRATSSFDKEIIVR